MKRNKYFNSLSDWTDEDTFNDTKQAGWFGTICGNPQTFPDLA